MDDYPDTAPPSYQNQMTVGKGEPLPVAPDPESPLSQYSQYTETPAIVKCCYCDKVSTTTTRTACGLGNCLVTGFFRFLYVCSISYKRTVHNCGHCQKRVGVFRHVAQPIKFGEPGWYDNHWDITREENVKAKQRRAATKRKRR